MTAFSRRAQTGVRCRENCFVRAAPSAMGMALGAMKRGEALPCGGNASPDGWLAVIYRGKKGWVSGRFAECVLQG